MISHSGRPRPWIFHGLPVVPGVALHLISVLTREDWTTREIVELSNADPSLVVDILNSANTGRAEERFCDSVDRAAVAVGSRRLHAICLASTIRQMMGYKGQTDLMGDCWRHSRAVALASQTLAPAFEIDSSRCYTAGLLHNVGLLALLAEYAPEYEDLLAVSSPDSGSILDAEKARFDIDHCEAGAWLCTHWSLPAAFQDVASAHHVHEPTTPSLLSLVVIAARAAEACGHQLGIPYSCPVADPTEAIALAVSIATGRDEARVHRYAAECVTSVSSDLTFAPIP
ncbi:MAG: HDOD domain-containing protein [Acidobacteria bacterium]|nr:HDOD domain-containing protein [Acidobacteriota bacterium]MDA1234930.1 HDOD domain-containing protein [Acidobacteriota bacterium]